MSETTRTLIPIVATHAFILVGLIVVIKQILMGDARRAVARVAQVESEVRKKEENIRREIAEHEREFAKRKAESESEIQKAKEAAEKETANLREQMVAEAKKESARLLDQAHRSEQSLRSRVAQEMEAKAVHYGADIVRLVFSEKMNAGLHAQFMAELLDALEQIDSASVTVDGTDAEFTSSHPLSPEQKQRFEGLLKEKFGVAVQVNEKIDEDLLAGLVFKLGTLEIDGSLRNRCREAAEEVVKEAHERTAG